MFITHLKNIIEKNASITTQNILLIYDLCSPLSILLTKAYKEILTSFNYQTIEFQEEKIPEIKQQCKALHKGDLVILVQSMNFRISDYRIRMELNTQGILVLEHSHLQLITEKQIPTYLNSLTYLYPTYKKQATALNALILKAKKITVFTSGGNNLVYEGPFEAVKENIGDLQQTLGSFYPIGEVFTEPCDLTKVNGALAVYAYPDAHYLTQIVKPFSLTIQEGCIISHDGPEAFEKLLELVRNETSEKKVHIREMGFGLNPFIGKEKPLGYVSAHERQNGFHLSLGLKHGIYRKKLPKHIPQKYHIDLFADVEEIRIDEKIIFSNRAYCL